MQNIIDTSPMTEAERREWQRIEDQQNARQNIIGQNGNDGDHYSKPAVYLDTETTGLFANRGAELLEIAIVEENGRVLIDSFIKPKIATEWPEAMAINHITPDMVKDAPTIDDLADDIIDAVVGRDVYIWNAKFDEQFVGFALQYANRVICAMREYGEFIQRTQPHNISPNGRYKLECTARDLKVDIEGRPHRALTDVLTTIHVRQAWTSGAHDNKDLNGSINVEPYKTQ